MKMTEINDKIVSTKFERLFCVCVTSPSSKYSAIMIINGTHKDVININVKLEGDNNRAFEKTTQF